MDFRNVWIHIGYILDTCRVSGITSELFSDLFAAICQGFRGDITRIFKTMILGLVEGNKTIWK